MPHEEQQQQQQQAPSMLGLVQDGQVRWGCLGWGGGVREVGGRVTRIEGGTCVVRKGCVRPREEESYLSRGPSQPQLKYPKVMPHAEQQQQQAQSMLGLVQDGQVRQGCVREGGGSTGGIAGGTCV